ncbi:hypothetical protein F5Y05DRAFT_412992 [Hypoxylon sp. FL0543]|nr:hypothetical protein F5Y05DRAFT_412992 [Hypoxylon sp. FL0543]
MPRNSDTMDNEYGKRAPFASSKVSKPTSTIHDDFARLADTARDPRYSHLFQNEPSLNEESPSLWKSKNYDREKSPSDGCDSADEHKFNNYWVEKSFEHRTGRHGAIRNKDSDKLMETANDPRYAHLFSHLRRRDPDLGPGETTTTGPARPTPKKATKTASDQPVLKRGVNYVVIDDSDTDDRPRKRFSKRVTPENSDDDGADSDGYPKPKGIRKFKHHD